MVSASDCRYQHRFFFFFWQNYYPSQENVFDVLTLFNVKLTVKTKYQMSIDSWPSSYSTSFWVNYSEQTYIFFKTWQIIYICVTWYLLYRYKMKCMCSFFENWSMIILIDCHYIKVVSPIFHDFTIYIQILI